MTKHCGRCGLTKPTDEFYSRGGGRPGLSPWCKHCTGEHTSSWRKANPDKRAAHVRKHRYGLTAAAYDALVATQRGACAICGDEGSKLFVDHDHDTGAVRGLLCTHCNRGVGGFAEPEMLRIAADYLEGKPTWLTSV